MPEGKLSQEAKQQLLSIARKSVHHGLLHGTPQPVDVAQYDEALSYDGASFVTLHLHGQLRGCIGSLLAHRPLAKDVAENAYSAAFKDPRFPPLMEQEEPELTYHISVLSEPEPLEFESESDLLEQIRPGVDGLVLKDGAFHKGTFLPSVWEQLPSKELFLSHLKQKAGLESDYWSPTIEVERYTVEDIEDTAA
ncbi:MAG: AmmeMemoRadiSam system protein A [Ketobacteraceae bacterium]|nr:AmmeMemoRadiSam system protein A [Ketobacteraceae bacterium]